MHNEPETIPVQPWPAEACTDVEDASREFIAANHEFRRRFFLSYGAVLAVALGSIVYLWKF